MKNINITQNISFKVKDFKILNGLNIKNSIITIIERNKNKFKITTNNPELKQEIWLDKPALKKLL